MPYSLKKLSKKCFTVVNTKTKKRFSKCSTKKNAKKQLKLLRAIMYNKKFVPRNNRTLKNKK